MASVLTNDDPQANLTISADASSYELGTVLLQKHRNRKRLPFVYLARGVTDTEKRYTQITKEALAVTWSCKHFWMYLVSLKFHVKIDHRLLVPLLYTRSLDKLPPRLQ